MQTESTQYAEAERRVPLCQGVIEIEIPADARRASIKTKDGPIEYYSFRLMQERTGAASIPCYLHGGESSLLGSDIRAHFILYRRRHKDGTENVHLDLRPADEEATNRVLFISKYDLPRCDPAWAHFPTPQVRGGLVVIAPRDAALKEGQITAAPYDPQLKRLEDAGWKIKEDRGDVLVLAKAKPGGGEKTMIHNRPKRR